MITNTIKYIIDLAGKKPILAVVTILLLGLTVLGGVIKIMDSRIQSEKTRLITKLDMCDSIRDVERVYYQQQIQFIQNKANEEVKIQLMESNRILQEKLDRLENVTAVSRKTLKDTKHTTESQNKIINQLKVNND